MKTKRNMTGLLLLMLLIASNTFFVSAKAYDGKNLPLTLPSEMEVFNEDGEEITSLSKVKYTFYGDMENTGIVAIDEYGKEISADRVASVSVEIHDQAKTKQSFAATGMWYAIIDIYLRDYAGMSIQGSFNSPFTGNYLTRTFNYVTYSGGEYCYQYICYENE